MRRHWMLCVTGSICLALGSAAPGVVNMEFVTVGNPQNEGEWSGESYGGFGPDRICGAVDYVYEIAKFEVTAGQYTEFLNAVAADTDTYGLYNRSMWTSTYACKIERIVSDGSYEYRVEPEWADRPVNYVGWGDAARFCNWLANGQPTGAQGLATTEDGSYYLDGATSDVALMGVTRKPNATYVIPTEDEWYKAAYHKNNGATGDYWDYATGTDTKPSNDLVEPDPGNNANFHDGTDYTIGDPYYMTDVGEFERSDSPYGTFDQCGNVWEWNEAILDPYPLQRGCRGGGLNEYDDPNPNATIHAAWRSYDYPSHDIHNDIGFRVALIPEVPITVEIDIKPGSDDNAINLGSQGVVPVAILSTTEFDATTVDPETVALAGAGLAVRGKSSKSMAHQEDINGDGLQDLVLQVYTTNLDPEELQDGTAVLTGKTFDGEPINGSDEITIVPPEN